MTEPVPPPPPTGPDDPTFVQGPVEPGPHRRVVVDEAPPSRNWWPLVALLFAILAVVFFVLWWMNRDSSNTHSVPNVIGMNEQQARTQADASGFDVQTVRRSGSGTAGTVLDQGPSPGVELEQGARMLIVVSSGAPTTVPSVIGMKVDAAKNALTTAKLTPKVQDVESATTAGVVVAQSPAAGGSTASGSTVLLSVSKGPPMVAVPSLRGLSVENATQKLADAGLSVRVIPVSSSEPRGTVIAQDPAGGQKVKKGSAVRINVSEGPTTTTTSPGTTVTVTVTTLTDTTAIP